MNLMTEDNFRLQDQLRKAEERLATLSSAEKTQKSQKSRKDEENEIINTNKLIGQNLQEVNNRDKQIESLKTTLSQTTQELNKYKEENKFLEKDRHYFQQESKALNSKLQEYSKSMSDKQNWVDQITELKKECASLKNLHQSSKQEVI